MIRRLRQPSALRVPNSRTRWTTAARVSGMATANDASRMTMASHRPRSLARPAVLASEPVTCPARLPALVTVAAGGDLAHAERAEPGAGGVDAIQAETSF